MRIMLSIYAPLKPAEIRKEAKVETKQIETWFEQHPKRRVCRAKLWYGLRKNICRGHVAEDVNTVAEAAIKSDRDKDLRRKFLARASVEARGKSAKSGK